jgi:hypothetical protein
MTQGWLVKELKQPIPLDKLEARSNKYNPCSI